MFFSAEEEVDVMHKTYVLFRADTGVWRLILYVLYVCVCMYGESTHAERKYLIKLGWKVKQRDSRTANLHKLLRIDLLIQRINK